MAGGQGGGWFVGGLIRRQPPLGWPACICQSLARGPVPAAGYTTVPVSATTTTTAVPVTGTTTTTGPAVATTV